LPQNPQNLIDRLVIIRSALEVDMSEEEVHSRHVAPLRKKHVVIEWSDPAPCRSAIRVRNSTCECMATVYELCSGAGLVHLRRMVRTPDGLRVSASPWLRPAEAEQLWEDLLRGRAR
jgi:hypothetical protein